MRTSEDPSRLALPEPRAGWSATMRVPLLSLSSTGPVGAAALFDPRLSPGSNSDLYHALPTAVGRGLARLHAEVPALNHWYVRLPEVGLVALGIVPLSVYAHESGHLERAAREGYAGYIEMTGLASGFTHYEYGSAGRPTPRTDVEISLAGVNQEERNSETIYRNATGDRGQFNWASGAAYLIARTNLPGYQFIALRPPPDLNGNGVVDPNEINHSNDMGEWGRWLESNGHSFNLSGSAWLSAGAAVASPMFWASLYGGVRYIVNGDSSTEVPSLHLGPVALQAPDLHVYLHPTGPLLEGRTAVRHDASGISVEAYGYGEVGGSSGGGGVAVNGIPVARGLTLSGRGGLSGGRTGLGYELGGGVSYMITPNLGLSGSVLATGNNPIMEATGTRTGVTGDFALRAHF